MPRKVHTRPSNAILVVKGKKAFQSYSLFVSARCYNETHNEKGQFVTDLSRFVPLIPFKEASCKADTNKAHSKEQLHSYLSRTIYKGRPQGIIMEEGDSGSLCLTYDGRARNIFLSTAAYNTVGSKDNSSSLLFLMFALFYVR